MFVSPGDIAFSIGPLSIYYYGIIMATAISVGVSIDVLITKKFYPELNSEIIYDISPHVIIGAIIGARAYYCLLSFPFFLEHPSEIIQLWHGGLSIHGAIIGGLITGLIYAKRHKLPVLKLCDIFAYGLILGQAIGRWGNFFNSEAFGRPTENFLKLYIPIYKRPLEYMQYNYFHPTFLYESLLDICIFLILFFVVRKLATSNVIARQKESKTPELATEAISSEKDGIVFFSYLILYSIARIIIEQVRIDSILNIYGIPVAEIMSALMIFAGIIGIVFIGAILKFKKHQ